MSSTPFRSHLLQQWSRSSQGRAPAAVVPWLRATPPPQRSTIDEDEDDNGLSRRQRRPARRNHRHHSSATSSTRTSTSTSTNGNGNRSSHRAMPPSLSTVDSAAISWAASSSSASTISIPPPMSPPARHGHGHRHRHMTTTPIRRSATSRFFASSVASSPSSDSSFDEDEDEEGAGAGADTNHAGVGDNETDDNVDVDDDNAFHSNTTAAMLQSLLQTRRTATRLKHDDTATATTSIIDETRLRQALHRAVACAQMAPNHKRTEPFSFRRFLAGSSTAARLAEISYQVTLRKTDSISNAASKRQKWLDIPGFLVALVHENQPPGSLPYLPRNTTGSTNNSAAAAAAVAEAAVAEAAAEEAEEEGSFDDYRPLPYLPPASERQLEDYAASSAAVQNVLLSLHAEGIGSKWATGPVIQTPAFRQLVHAEPTDRIAALIMLGGSTDFADEREERRTQARLTRRRSIGDLLTDLP